MSFTKQASLDSAQVLDIRSSPTKGKISSLSKFADFDNYRTEDGYLYARIRAISSRVNKNFDGWPSIELAGGEDIFNRIAGIKTGSFIIEADSNAKYGYSTFLGKPIFVDHNNSDPSRARGVIVDAKLHVESSSDDPYYSSAPDNHKPPTWVELLLEIDAKSFPKLAAAIIEGSKDPTKGIDGFSMGCFIAGTPITLADGTRKAIENIQLGDEVLTHTGKTEPVTYLMKRPHQGIVYKVETYGQAQSMILTEEHPVWTKGGWKEAKDLQKGEMVLTPMPEGVGHPGSYPFAKLLGYYLAEGNTGYDKKRFPDGRPTSVEWNFHEDEIEQISEVKILLEALGYKSAGPYIKNSCASIRCNNPELAQKFVNYGGKYSWNKKLDSEVLRWDIDNQRAVLDAYFIGDASRLSDRRVEICTASTQLASQLQLLASRVGYRMTPPIEQYSPSAIKAGKRPKYSMQALLVEPAKGQEKLAYLDQEGLWRKITSISTQDHNGFVYNFDVEGDDSYVAADVAVHNCNVEYTKCSHCGNKATSPDQFCEHVKLKGAEFPWTDPRTGRTSSRKAYEDCYGIGYFEISAVFDPADETALLREIRTTKTAGIEDELRGFQNDQYGNPLPSGDIACPECRGQGCAMCGGTGQMNSQPITNAGTDGVIAPTYIQNDQVPVAWDPGYLPKYQGNFAKGSPEGNRHLAEAPLPQVEDIKVPEKIDTLREDQVCPVCGSDSGGDTQCPVCGYEFPPEGFRNPDLSKAREEQEVEEMLNPSNSGPELSMNTRKPDLTAHINSDMSWEVNTRTSFTNPATETPVVPKAGPATDEPKNAVVKQDHSKPVTSKVRTAEDFLKAAERRQTMPEKTAEAASGAPEAATPDTNVDVTGVGGVIEDSNEAASKADAQVDVTGVGATGTSDVAADKTESVDQGDAHTKNVEEIPTMTYDNGTGVEEQREPVTSDPYPGSGGVTSAQHEANKYVQPAGDGKYKIVQKGTGKTLSTHDSKEKAEAAFRAMEMHKHEGSWEVTALDSNPFPADDGGLSGGQAVQGVQPADPVGVAEERVNVLDAVTTPANNSGETKTWSGTDGNGVLRQQDPVTQETLEGEDIVNLSPTTSSHIFAAMKLADKEVALGLTDPNQKYERAAELEKLTPAELQAEARVIDRVKTAGLSKGQPAIKRLPQLGRNSHVEKESKQSNDTLVEDSLLFMK